MTRDQLAMICASIAGGQLLRDDNTQGTPQETVNQFFKYLDTAVPGLKGRMDHYEQQLGMNFSAGGGDEETGPMNQFLKLLTPDVIKGVTDLAKGLGK